MTNTRQHEDLVALISDAHIGKATPSFDLEVAHKRLLYWALRIRALTELMSGRYSFDTLHLCFLGDINDGTDIYATQPHHQAETNVLKQALLCASYFSEAMDIFLRCFPRIKIWAVPGNHGRSGKRAAEGASWDCVFYQFLNERYADNDRVECKIQLEHDFTLSAKIRHHTILLYHGHYIRMYQQIPWYGIYTRTLRWAHAFAEDFRVLCLSHFHTCGMMWLNDTAIFLNGTLITDDIWAKTALGFNPITKWWIFGASDTRIPTFHFDIDIAPDDIDAALELLKRQEAKKHGRSRSHNQTRAQNTRSNLRGDRRKRSARARKA